MLSPEQVLALAPDPGAAKAGQTLAKASKWIELGSSGSVFWGKIRGSGDEPYSTTVDTGGPAYKCSCPSRKFPCKHALGLMLLGAQEPDALPSVQAPEWVREWLEKRTHTAERRAQRNAAPPKPPDPIARRRRAAVTDERVKAGLAELRLWLGDLVQSGFADAKARPPSFWEAMAARLVDAQAGGLARRVRQMGDLVLSGERWQERVLHQAARLELAVEAFSHSESLSPELVADLRTEIGFVTRQQDLVESQPRVTDRWHVVGRRVDETLDENLKFARSWLRGSSTERMALVLSFAAGMQPLDTSLLPGFVVDADLVFYPSAHPLRAIVVERRGSEPGATLGPGLAPSAALRQAALALSRNPWVDRLPLTLSGVRLEWQTGDEPRFWAVTAGEPKIPLYGTADVGWSLLAVTGGRPAALFGEWGGESLRVMSVEARGAFFAVRSDVTGPLLIRGSEVAA